MGNRLTANQLLTQFEINLYEAGLRTCPHNIDALMALSYTYTGMGLYEKSLAVDKKVVNLLPEDPVARYNLACDYSLLKMLDEAFIELELACLVGYDDFEYLAQDPDLANLRQDPRYQQILTRLKSHPSPK